MPYETSIKKEKKGNASTKERLNKSGVRNDLSQDGQWLEHSSSDSGWLKRMRMMFSKKGEASGSQKEGNTPVQSEFESYRNASGENAAETSPEVQLELIELKRKIENFPKIQEYISRPAEKCEIGIPSVVRFAENDGFYDIKVRGMYIWSNGSDKLPSNHFLIVGWKNNQQYAIDITAGQFGNKGMVGLNGPLYLTEPEWAKKYQASTKLRLIKYQDFNHINAAKSKFNIFPTVKSPIEYMAGTTRLTEPNWYKALTKK